jgi:hypothetical protein
MPSPALRERLETLQNILVSRATGGAADEDGYRELRTELLKDASLAAQLPPFVRTCRDLSQFWSYIKKDRPQYENRRQHIWESFAPALDYAEFGAKGEATSASGSATMATEIDLPDAKNRPRAFISYSTADREVARELKKVFEAFGIEAFLAHEDIQVSDEWRRRILAELLTCNIFVPILSRSFLASDWCPQEVGVVSGREAVAVVPLSLDDTIPRGFIAHIQGRRVTPGEIGPADIITPLANTVPRLVLPGMIIRVANAKSFRSAEAAMEPLVPHFGRLTNEEAIQLGEAARDNGQVWSAHLCAAEYLPAFLRSNRDRLPVNLWRKLAALIELDRKNVAQKA